MCHRHACVQEQQAAHKASLAAAESALRKAEAATASAEGAASAANDAMEGAAAAAMASIQQAALSAATDAGAPKLDGLACFASSCFAADTDGTEPQAALSLSTPLLTAEVEIYITPARLSLSTPI